MNNWFDRVVKEVLVRHLLRPTDAISATDHLERDLGVLPLDLVMISLALEELIRIRIPADGLASIRTVEDLSRLVWYGAQGTDVAGIERQFASRKEERLARGARARSRKPSKDGPGRREPVLRVVSPTRQLEPAGAVVLPLGGAGRRKRPNVA